jgi:hypothetical protein
MLISSAIRGNHSSGNNRKNPSQDCRRYVWAGLLVLKLEGRLTPEFSCKHVTTIAAKPHPKNACLLQRSLDSEREKQIQEW